MEQLALALYLWLARPAFHVGDCIAIVDGSGPDEWEYSRAWNPMVVLRVGTDSYATAYIGFPDVPDGFVAFKHAFMYEKIDCPQYGGQEEPRQHEPQVEW